jgi:hypothetical protein
MLQQVRLNSVMHLLNQRQTRQPPYLTVKALATARNNPSRLTAILTMPPSLSAGFTDWVATQTGTSDISQSNTLLGTSEDPTARNIAASCSDQFQLSRVSVALRSVVSTDCHYYNSSILILSGAEMEKLTSFAQRTLSSIYSFSRSGLTNVINNHLELVSSTNVLMNYKY